MPTLRLLQAGGPPAVPEDLRCHEVTAVLLEYLEYELAPPTRAAVDDHLSRCDHCVGYVRDYQQTLHLVRAACRS